MDIAEKINKLNEWELKLSSYEMVLALLSYDKQTIAPENGNEYRDTRMGYLYGEYFDLLTDKNAIDLFNSILNDENTDGVNKRKVTCYLRDVNKTLCIPKDEYIAYQKLQSESFSAWSKAKKENDYSIFEPYLKRIIEATKKIVSYRNDGKDIYDSMLDDYQPGMNQASYDDFFKKVQQQLVPLIHKVIEAKPIDTSFLNFSYAKDKQRIFMKTLLEYLNYDSSWGYLGESAHPFTDEICINDVRTTTRYIEDNISSALLSTIHEVGHAYYAHQVNPLYDGTILGNGMASGIHESQSRLLENYIARTVPFWTNLYPDLQKIFPDQLGNISIEQFVDALNASTPGLIRTEADELTYPIHILIRYELEKGLFNGTISTENLDQVWNDMYQKYLGISSETATNGILQDVHWSDGSFGYFPTYALGSAFSAQFYNQMKKDIDIEKLLATDHFDAITDWLKDHVHTYGNRYEANEILEKATGEPFNSDYYFNYLIDKYTKLYNL